LNSLCLILAMGDYTKWFPAETMPVK